MEFCYSGQEKAKAFHSILHFYLKRAVRISLITFGDLWRFLFFISLLDEDGAVK